MLDFSVTLIITIINIIILTFILRAILFKPVTKFMADRAKRLQDSIEQSERDRSQAKKLLDEYETKLKAAEAEAEEILKNAKEEAETEAAAIVAQGKAEAERFVAAGRGQIDAERKAAIARFKIEAAALVVAASGRLLKRDFNTDDHRRYAAMLLEELSLQGAALQGTGFQGTAQKGSN